MEVMMVGRQTRAQAARFVDFLNSYHTSGILWSEPDPILPHKRERYKIERKHGRGEGWPLGRGVEPRPNPGEAAIGTAHHPPFHLAQLNPLIGGGGGGDSGLVLEKAACPATAARSKWYGQDSVEENKSLIKWKGAIPTE